MFTSRTSLSVLLVALLAGCAQTRMDAQWSAKDVPPGALKAARVIVQCQAPSETEARICADSLAAELRARGLDPRVGDPIPAGVTFDAQQLAGAARAAGASAAVVSSLAAGALTVQPASTVSIGIGGGSWGGGGGFGGVSGSVAAPVLAGSVNQSLAASTTVTLAGTAKPIWSGRASSGAQGTATQQIGDLSRATVEAMQGAGLF
jgi:hypothetical protein